MGSQTLHLVSLITCVLICIAINVIGLRFLLVPRDATLHYGVAPNDVRALTAIKGIRDISSGVVPLVIWRVAGTRAFGWAILSSAITPIGDMIVVFAQGGEAAAALGIHGVTAVVLIAAGSGLARRRLIMK
jgi:hypothetical protein